MSERERESFEDYIKAMSKDEMEMVAMIIDIDILWDVLRKRETENRNMVKEMKELVFGK